MDDPTSLDTGDDERVAVLGRPTVGGRDGVVDDEGGAPVLGRFVVDARGGADDMDERGRFGMGGFSEGALRLLFMDSASKLFDLFGCEEGILGLSESTSLLPLSSLDAIVVGDAEGANVAGNGGTGGASSPPDS